MNTTHEQLLADVEQFLKSEGMSPTRFGWLAARDYTAVTRLRQGKGITLRRADRYREFMASFKAEKRQHDRLQAAE
jgi:hypothetical protein